MKEDATIEVKDMVEGADMAAVTELMCSDFLSEAIHSAVSAGMTEPF